MTQQQAKEKELQHKVGKLEDIIDALHTGKARETALLSKVRA